MGLFKAKKVVDEAELANEMPVRIEVGNKIIPLEEVQPRAVRRMIEKESQKFRKKYAQYKELVDSEGKRVTIVIKSEKALSLSVNVALEFPEELQPQIKKGDEATRIS